MTPIQIPHIDYTKTDSLTHQHLENALLYLVKYAAVEDQCSANQYHVLDVGSGRGEVLRHLSETGFVSQGIDIDPKCVELSSRYSFCTLGNIEDLASTFQENQFDVVIASHILEHCENPYQALTMLKHVSKRWLVLAVPNPLRPKVVFLNLMKQFYSHKTHFYAWDASHFSNFLVHHGNLTIVKWYGDGFHIPLMGRIRLQTDKLDKGFFLDTLEAKILPLALPYFTTSHIVLVHK